MGRWIPPPLVGFPEVFPRVAGPMIVRVRLFGPQFVSAQGSQSSGWSPGFDHTLIIYRFKQTRWLDLWDPATPIQGNGPWSVDDLRDRWSGEAIRLVKRR